MTSDAARDGPRVAQQLALPRCALGESPRWAHGRWWWVDAARGCVWSSSPDFREFRQHLDEGPRTSLVHPATHGRVVVVRDRAVVIVDPRDDVARPWAEIPLDPGWVLNDGVADAMGALWIGSVHPARSPGTGLLHRIDRRGRVATFRSGTALSNGMAWVDSERLVVADSIGRVLLEFSASPGVAALSRSWSLPSRAGVALPDGVCLDAEGGLWVALYGAGEVVRFVDDEAVDVIRVPTPQVTSVALGGTDGRDVLITTAQEGMSDDEVRAAPAAGAVFRARVDIPGVAPFAVDPLD